MHHITCGVLYSVSFNGINKVTVIHAGPVACKQYLTQWPQCSVLLTDTTSQRTAVRACLDVWL